VFLRFRQIGCLARRQDDLGSLLAERFGDLQSKSARSAGDKCGLSLKIKRLLHAAHVWFSSVVEQFSCAGSVLPATEHRGAPFDK
jgi:hypothetical protein